ncbi:MAG: HupE/UreJ family protein [Gammaproteobacteria bacterium]|nr:HupE/UreJ family protein [Gammaproteobacteria bacterium]
MQKTSISTIVTGLAALFATPAVFAHGGIHMDLGLIDGFMHPASGIDHLLVAIAAGFWAARRGNHGLRDMSFVLALFAGGLLLGVVSLGWPQLNLVLPVAFLLVTSVLAVAIARPRLFAHTLFGGLAVYQGLTHMIEVPAASGMAGFGAGLFLSTAILMELGLMLRTVINTYRSHTAD